LPDSVGCKYFSMEFRSWRKQVSVGQDRPVLIPDVLWILFWISCFSTGLSRAVANIPISSSVTMDFDFVDIVGFF
ncbi:MAG: hypothetical protein LBI37_01115, partial [Puniceicoccales bacterium]|nr:hypothetical protein [Puniceicoccales bacterium]